MTIDPILTPTQFHNMTVRKFMHHFARVYGSPVCVIDVITESIRVGFYSEKQAARNTLYSEFRRLATAGEWLKIAPGQYKQIKDPFASAQPINRLTQDTKTKQLRELITELRTESQEIGIDPRKYKSPWELLASVADRIEATLTTTPDMKV